MTEIAVKELLDMLDNRQDGIAEVLTEMEQTHNEAELAESKSYCALMSASLWLARIEESVHYWLHRDSKPTCK